MRVRIAPRARYCKHPSSGLSCGDAATCSATRNDRQGNRASRCSSDGQSSALVKRRSSVRPRPPAPHASEAHLEERPFRNREDAGSTPVAGSRAAVAQWKSGHDLLASAEILSMPPGVHARCSAEDHGMSCEVAGSTPAGCPTRSWWNSGIHARFRTACRKAWGFDSPRAHAATPWGRSSVGRALLSQCRGRRFDSARFHSGGQVCGARTAPGGTRRRRPGASPGP